MRALFFPDRCEPAEKWYDITIGVNNEDLTDTTITLSDGSILMPQTTTIHCNS